MQARAAALIDSILLRWFNGDASAIAPIKELLVVLEHNNGVDRQLIATTMG